MRKLGKQPYVHDPRTLRLEKYATALPAPHPWVNWSLKVPSWPMFLNNDIGDCTIAAAAHMIESWSADVGPEAPVNNAQVLTAYSAVSGYNPSTGANDNGARISDILRYWRLAGIGGHKIGAYASVAPANRTLLHQSIQLFGGVDIGIQLPVAAQSMGTHWTMGSHTNPVGNYAPGSWGGHSVSVLGYNDWSFVCVSWGQIIRIDNAFWNNYVDEVWAILSEDFMRSDGISASGLNLVQLQADLAQV